LPPNQLLQGRESAIFTDFEPTSDQKVCVLRPPSLLVQILEPFSDLNSDIATSI
jgi:hypothetical protein